MCTSLAGAFLKSFKVELTAEGHILGTQLIYTADYTADLHTWFKQLILKANLQLIYTADLNSQFTQLFYTADLSSWMTQLI